MIMNLKECFSETIETNAKDTSKPSTSAGDGNPVYSVCAKDFVMDKPNFRLVHLLNNLSNISINLFNSNFLG